MPGPVTAGPRARRLALTAALALALAGLVGPVVAAPVDAAGHRAPSASDIAKAKRNASAAKQELADLRTRAEAAVEAYNAATVAAAHAHTVALAKATVARQAQQEARLAASAAATAKATSDAAAAKEAQARAALAAADARVAAATDRFASIAVSAYETGAGMNQISAVIDSANPMEFALRQAMVSQVGRYQQSVVGELAIARADQENATEAAKQAAAAASDAAAVAAERSTAATAAADRARATAIDAADADAAAHAAALAAAAAKRQAAADVDAQVGRVSHLYANVKDLERQAAEARRQAALARRHQQVAPSAAAATAVRWAYKEIGVPYSWGGGNAQGPTYGVAQGANILGFDCSGLTLFAYAHAGIQLDHYTGSQWQSGPHVSQGQLRPGDLVFFATDTSNAATIHHVGLFIGNGMMIEAPETGLVVRVAPAFRPGYIGAVRPWATVIG